jgi:hypothetical protein
VFSAGDVVSAHPNNRRYLMAGVLTKRSSESRVPSMKVLLLLAKEGLRVQANQLE